MHLFTLIDFGRANTDAVALVVESGDGKFDRRVLSNHRRV